jgi:hypothetical protein
MQAELGRVLELRVVVLRELAVTFAIHSALGIRVDLVVVGLVVLSKVSTVLV